MKKKVELHVSFALHLLMKIISFKMEHVTDRYLSSNQEVNLFLSYIVAQT